MIIMMCSTANALSSKFVFNTCCMIWFCSNEGNWNAENHLSWFKFKVISLRFPWSKGFWPLFYCILWSLFPSFSLNELWKPSLLLNHSLQHPSTHTQVYIIINLSRCKRRWVIEIQIAGSLFHLSLLCERPSCGIGRHCFTLRLSPVTGIN